MTNSRKCLMLLKARQWLLWWRREWEYTKPCTFLWSRKYHTHTFLLIANKLLETQQPDFKMTYPGQYLYCQPAAAWFPDHPRGIEPLALSLSAFSSCLDLHSENKHTLHLDLELYTVWKAGERIGAAEGLFSCTQEHVCSTLWRTCLFLSIWNW